MPYVYAAIEAVEVALAEYGISAAVTDAVISAAASMAVSYTISSYTAAQQRRAAKDAYNASLQDRAVVIRSAIAPRPVVYGDTIVGGPIVFIGSEGAKNEFLHIVVAVAGHEIEAINDVYFNDESIGPLGTTPGDPNYGAVLSGGYNMGGTTFHGDPHVVPSSGIITLPEGAQVQSVVKLGPVGAAGGGPNSPGDIVLVKDVDYKITNATVELLNLTEGDNGLVTVGSTVVVNYDLATAGAPYVFVFKYLGGPGQAASGLLKERFPGVWTDQHVGVGVAYVHVLLVYNMDIFGNGVPTMKFRVRGKKVYDPRTGQTVYSGNPALQARDYLVDPLGFNCDPSEINDALVIAAANVCDEQVQVGINPSGQPIFHSRYVGAGLVSTGSDRKSNLEQILSAMGPGEAGATYSQGQWNIYAGAYRAPVMSLSDKDLTGSSAISIIPKLPRASLYNEIHGTFIDPTQGYQAIDFPPVTNATYVAQDDGEALIKDLEMPFTDDSIRAQRMAKVVLERSRSSCMVTAPFKLRAYALTPFDTVSLTLARYGFVNKPFDVVDREFDPQGGINLTLREANPTMWNWSYTGAQLTQPPPPSQLPNPFTVGMLTIRSAVSDQTTLQIQDDGTIIPRVLLTWDESADSNVFYGGTVEIQYIRSGDSTWSAMAAIRGIETQTYLVGPKAGGWYVIRARFVNGIGVTSPDWAYIGVGVQGKLTPPSNVPSITVTAEPFGLRVRWGAIPDKDLQAYDLRVGPSWEAGTPLVHGRINDYLDRVSTVGDYDFWVKAQDTSGNYSVSAAVTSFQIVVPAPSNISGSINGTEMVLSWAAVTGTFGIDHYELRVGATWDVAVPLTPDNPRTITSSTTYRQQINFGGTETFWVAAVDVAGNVGTPVSTTVTVPAPKTVSATASVIDNFVYLRIDDARTVLPVTRYVIRKGASFASGADVGDNGDGRFAVFFESTSGVYTYWIVAYDSAGNASIPSSVSAAVDQPPDYILRDDIHSIFDGARTNAVEEDGRLYAPLPVQTWQQHFESGGVGGSGGVAYRVRQMAGKIAWLARRAAGTGGSTSWSTPQDQVDAGYPLYFEPSLSSGSYEEVILYGALIPVTTITATLSASSLVGEVDATCTISYRASSSDPWTLGPSGATQVVGTNFRQVRVHYDFVAAGPLGANVMEVTDLEIKLSVKLRNDAGMGTALASDPSGTFVPFSYAFIDVSSITVTGNDTAAAILTYAFLDEPNPTGFYVYAWDKNGNRITKDFSWSAKGY